MVSDSKEMCQLYYRIGSLNVENSCHIRDEIAAYADIFGAYTGGRDAVIKQICIYASRFWGIYIM